MEVPRAHRAPVHVVLTGAGLSTDAGIPDFRSPGGVWERFDPMEFHIDRFHADPARFWQRRAKLIAAMDYLDVQPTEAHILLADAARDGWRIITQNVDGLHAAAGTPAARLLEIHGNGRNTVCIDCGAKEPVEDTLARHVEGIAPRCDCSGLLKPDVVLFGEPVHGMVPAMEWVQDASHLLVIGTSLQVHPAAGLVGLAAADDTPITIVNRDPTPYDSLATVVQGDIQDNLPDVVERLRSGSITL